MKKSALKCVLIAFVLTIMLSVSVQASDPSSSALESVNLCLPQSIDFHEILAGGTVPWENHRDCHKVWECGSWCQRFCELPPEPNNTIPYVWCCVRTTRYCEVNVCPREDDT